MNLRTEFEKQKRANTHFLWRRERKKDTSTNNKLSIIRCHMPHQKEEDAVMLART